MKADLHPVYHSDAAIKCMNCGHTFKTGATQEKIEVEICSQCHPFYTGKNVLIDTEGRVDRFRKKMESAQGRKKKDRKKKTLEEKVNEEIAEQLKAQAIETEKEEIKKAEKKAAKAAKKEEAAKVAETLEAVEEAVETPEESAE